MRIFLGNNSAVTIIDAPAENTLLEVLSDVRDLWGHHSDQAVPDWVAAEDDTIAAAIGQQFAGVEVKSYADGEAAYELAVNGPPATPDSDVTTDVEAVEGAAK